MSPITDYLHADHDRLNVLLNDFLDYLTTDFDQAKKCFVDYKQELEQHMIWEEKILFPHFKAYLALIHGPIHTMRNDHNEIRQALVDIEQQIADYTGEKEFDENLHIFRLERLLLDHNLKEEQILYPKLDSLLTEKEAKAIIASIEQFTFETTKNEPVLTLVADNH